MGPHAPRVTSDPLGHHGGQSFRVTSDTKEDYDHKHPELLQIPRGVMAQKHPLLLQLQRGGHRTKTRPNTSASMGVMAPKHPELRTSDLKGGVMAPQLAHLLQI